MKLHANNCKFSVQCMVAESPLTGRTIWMFSYLLFKLYTSIRSGLKDFQQVICSQEISEQHVCLVFPLHVHVVKMINYISGHDLFLMVGMERCPTPQFIVSTVSAGTWLS